jgi:Polyketide cyclase / dehydrase and lipid transport
VDGYPARPVSVSGHIPAPPDVVFDLVSDTRNDPLWCENVEKVDLIEGSGVEVGTRFRFHQHLDRPGAERMQFDVDVEVIEMKDRSIRWQANDRFQIREISLVVEPDGSGSRITQVTTATFLRPPGMAKWLYPLLARRIFRKQFRDLAAYFEQTRPQSP